VVLRYGHLYGPGTGFDVAGEPPSLHVDAAAAAALLAIKKTPCGIYNIAEPNEYLSTDKAQRELGFNAAFRLHPSRRSDSNSLNALRDLGNYSQKFPGEREVATESAISASQA
jgi:nucleoside-diphosphate-sugar epimerase